MPYNESHSELRDHPKTKRLKRALGTSLPATIGYLQCFWWWVMDYAPKGDLSAFDAADIADGAEWEGDPDAFIEALLTCGPAGKTGFMEHTTDGRLLVHDWWQYGGKLIVKRWVDAFRKRHNRVPTHAEKIAAGLPLPPADYIEDDTDSGPSNLPKSEGVAPSAGGKPERAKPSVPPPSEVAGREAERSVAERSVAYRSVSEENSSREGSVRGEADQPVVLPPNVDSRLPAAAFSQSERDLPEVLPAGALLPPISLPAGVDGSLVACLIEQLSLNRSDAIRFARDKPEECRRQLAHEPFFTKHYTAGKGAYWRRAIEEGYDAPKGFEVAQERKADHEKRTAQDEIRKRQTAEAEERRNKVDAQYQTLLESVQSNPDNWKAVNEEAKSQLTPLLLAKFETDPESPMIKATLNNIVRRIINRDYSAQNTAPAP